MASDRQSFKVTDLNVLEKIYWIIYNLLTLFIVTPSMHSEGSLQDWPMLLTDA